MNRPLSFWEFYRSVITKTPAQTWRALDWVGRILVAVVGITGVLAIGGEVPGLYVAVAVLLLVLAALLRLIHAEYEGGMREAGAENARLRRDHATALEVEERALQEERSQHASTSSALDALRNSRPAIQLGEPIPKDNEYIDRTHLVPDNSRVYTVSAPPMVRVPFERVPVFLFRIPVTNNGGRADSAYVQLREISPPINQALIPAPLHLAGNNPDDHAASNYGRSLGFPVGRGDTQQIDLIAVEKKEPYRCFLYTATSDDAAIEVSLPATSIFRLVAYAGDESFSQDYRVDVDGIHLSVALDKGGNSSTAS